MSIVLTNWQAAFQRERGTRFFTVYAVLVAVVGFAAWVRGSSHAGAIVDGLGFLLLIGPAFAIVRLQRGILAQSLLFCLPGYRESLRALTFSGAIVFGLAWSSFSLMPLRQPMTSTEIGLNLASGFLTGIVLYLALTTPRLILSRRTFIWVRRVAVLLFLVGGELLFELETDDAPFAIRPVLMPVLVVLCAFVWIRLGNMEFVKRGQGIVLEDAIARGPFPGPPRTTLPWVEKWLQSQMERQSYLQGGRYVWGELYGTVGRLLHYWKWILGVLIGITWLVGYPGQFAASTIFVASGSLVWMQRWPLASPLLLPGGRRERCRATLGAVLAMSLLLMAAALAIVVLSWVLTPFLGGPPAEGSQATYKVLQARSIVLACLLVPWFAALGLFGVRVPSLGEFVAIVFFVVAPACIFLALAMEMWPDWTQPIVAIVAARVYVASGVFVTGWLFLLLILWAASRRWDLIGQQAVKAD